MKPFKTADIGLATYLHYEGMEFLGCIPSGETGRLYFVFEDAEPRDNLQESWMTHRATVDAKLYEMKRKTLMRALKTPVTGTEV